MSLASSDSRMAVLCTKRRNNILNDYHFSHRETKSVPSTYNKKPVSTARRIERLLFAQNQFSVSSEILVGKQLIFFTNHGRTTEAKMTSSN